MCGLTTFVAMVWCSFCCSWMAVVIAVQGLFLLLFTIVDLQGSRLLRNTGEWKMGGGWGQVLCSGLPVDQLLCRARDEWHAPHGKNRPSSTVFFPVNRTVHHLSRVKPWVLPLKSRLDRLIIIMLFKGRAFGCRFFFSHDSFLCCFEFSIRIWPATSCAQPRMVNGNSLFLSHFMFPLPFCRRRYAAWFSINVGSSPWPLLKRRERGTSLSLASAHHHTS